LSEVWCQSHLCNYSMPNLFIQSSETLSHGPRDMAMRFKLFCHMQYTITHHSCTCSLYLFVVFFCKRSITEFYKNCKMRSIKAVVKTAKPAYQWPCKIQYLCCLALESDLHFFFHHLTIGCFFASIKFEYTKVLVLYEINILNQRLVPQLTWNFIQDQDFCVFKFGRSKETTYR
jgi:hypothetical protein